MNGTDQTTVEVIGTQVCVRTGEQETIFNRRDWKTAADQIGILHSAIARNTDRQRVLVLVHGDGWIEVYGPQNIDVRIQMVPWCGGRDQAAEVLAEQWVIENIPLGYSAMYRPWKRRKTAMWRIVTPESIANSNAWQWFSKAMERWRKKWVPEQEDCQECQ